MPRPRRWSNTCRSGGGWVPLGRREVRTSRRHPLSATIRVSRPAATEGEGRGAMTGHQTEQGPADVLRVATYGRISGHEDQIKADRKGIKVLSLDVQAEQTHAFVRKHGGVVTRTLSD